MKLSSITIPDIGVLHYQTVRYQDQTRTKGATLRTARDMSGDKARTDNYRIGTDNVGTLQRLSIWDYRTTQPMMLQSLVHPTVTHTDITVLPATTGTVTSPDVTLTLGDMPDGFTFEYFGTEYNGSGAQRTESTIGRMGNMYFKADGSTAIERSQTSWESTGLSAATAEAHTAEPVQSHHGGVTTLATTATITPKQIVL